MKAICLLVAVTIGQGRAVEVRVPISTADFSVPSALYAFQQPPGGFGVGGGPGLGMPPGGMGMGSMNGMGMGSSQGMGMSGSGMGMMNAGGMGTMNSGGMSQSGGWNQLSQQAQNSATSATSTSTRPAEILSDAAQDELELTPRQRRRLKELQKKVDAALEDMLTEDQQGYLQVMAARRSNSFAARP